MYSPCYPYLAITSTSSVCIWERCFRPALTHAGRRPSSKLITLNRIPSFDTQNSDHANLQRQLCGRPARRGRQVVGYVACVTDQSGKLFEMLFPPDPMMRLLLELSEIVSNDVCRQQMYLYAISLIGVCFNLIAGKKLRDLQLICIAAVTVCWSRPPWPVQSQNLPTGPVLALHKMATDPRLAKSVDPRRTATPQQPPPPPPPQQINSIPKPHTNGNLDGTNGAQQDDGGYRLRFCTVCASNQNRYEAVRAEGQNIRPLTLASTIDLWKPIFAFRSHHTQ